jgi:hypothetical protein
MLPETLSSPHPLDVVDDFYGDAPGLGFVEDREGVAV